MAGLTREETSRKPPRTYYCRWCKRKVELAPNQKDSNYHRCKHGEWCSSPPSNGKQDHSCPQCQGGR